MTDGARGLSQHLSMVESYRERKRSGLSGLSLRFDASYGSGALRPITCRYGLSRGSGSDQSSPGSTSSSAPGSADLRSPLLPWDSRPGSSDIVQAAQERNTRKETKGRALGEAHRALSDPFTLGRGQPSLAELAGQWQPLPPVQQQPEPTDDYDIMRRPGGERKLRPMRVQEHRAEDMMVRGHGLDMTRHAADKGKFGISQQGTREEKAEAAKAAPGKKAAPSDAEKEQQRIRATMASMRNELMGVGAEPDAPPLVDGQRSSGLLEEAASRGARMRQSRELRLTGGVQSTSDPSWGQRKVVAPRRSTESTAPTEPGAPDLFTRIDPREAVRTCR
ncbi:uncharacterized protein LOC119090516 [Pollicipes pollicipes]|uniref:uncharacterized protein LOC119090516 n=1 Tax=Pollicipes pollicipes TaxID=41117 RepID=UPI00188547D7|nr:uncharacterized protein LOC119090516 [Pollicipes pollicipes]